LTAFGVVFYIPKVRLSKGGVMTLIELRAQIETGKQQAMTKFERDWGTRDVRLVADALRTTIPTSANPADAAHQARVQIEGKVS
jgi:hypothetical protein